MEVGDRIRILRKEYLKLSQTAFGEKIGINRDALNNIENNRLKKPEQKEPVYKLICKEFNISYSWLMTGYGDMYADDGSEAMAIVDSVMASDNEFAKSVLVAFAKLDEEDWKIVKKIIDDIKK